MGLDTIAKRYFPVVICALLATVAFFQARGIGALVAGQLPEAPSASFAHATPGPPPDRPTGRGLTALPILARNAFDSLTGPLDKPPPASVVTSAPTTTPATDEDPPCPSGSVVLIADSADPAWSFALIRTTGGSKMRRIGDDVDGQKVKDIAWDRVWLSSAAGRCQIKLDITGKKGAAPAKPGVPAQPAPPNGQQPDASGDVTKVSDNEFIVSRAAVEKAQGFGNEMKKGTRLVPGKGIRLSIVDPNGLLGKVGVTTGDIVKTINGFDMTDLDKASEGFNRLKTSKELTLAMERDGVPRTLTVRIQ